MKVWRRSALAILALSVIGARAGGAEPESPTWAKDVAPILYRHCVECHRPGQVGPFSLVSHTDAAKRAKFLVKTVHARAMPPWLPEDQPGTFLDERRLSETEIAVLQRWMEAGAPAGDLAAAPPLPPEPSAAWRLGKPDLVVKMRQPFPVPAGPGDTYQVFPVAYSLAQLPAAVRERARIPESDVLGVAAVEIRPGNPRVMHHADLWVDLGGTARQREAAAGGNGFESFGTPGFPPAVALGGRVPGMTTRRLPSGIAASVLPPEGDIVFQIHYRATGKPETDQSEVGLYFMREPVQRIMDSLMLRSFKLDIPAGRSDFTVEDTLEVPAECILMNILPHMHLVAREVQAELINPDGTTRPLITIKQWNFKWQDRYVYREPILLPKGSRIRARWVFDNSADNPNNPHSPPQAVQFGPNATDEMCAITLGVIPVNLEESSLFAASREQKLRESVAALTPEQRARHNWGEAFGNADVP